MARLSGRGRSVSVRLGCTSPILSKRSASATPAVRLAAATGLSHIDKRAGIEVYKQHNVQDASAALRQLVFDAAGQAGQPADLEWLSGYVSSNGQSEAAVEAFGAICQRAEGQIVQQWAERLIRTGRRRRWKVPDAGTGRAEGCFEKNEMLLAESRVRLAGGLCGSGSRRNWRRICNGPRMRGKLGVSGCDGGRIA